MVGRRGDITLGPWGVRVTMRLRHADSELDPNGEIEGCVARAVRFSISALQLSLKLCAYSNQSSYIYLHKEF